MRPVLSRRPEPRAIATSCRRPSLRVTARYFLLQIPGWLAGALVVFGLRELAELDAWVTGLLLGTWIVKDFLLFPWIWPGYVSDAPSPCRALIGARGVAVERLAPCGYVRVGGELWKAEARETGRTFLRGAPVCVVDTRGMTLIVAEQLGGPRSGASPD